MIVGVIQTDDVGTRHQGKNCYTNVICNEFFVYLTTTESKSRINFLKILAQSRNEYRFNQDAYDYLAVYKGAERLIQVLNDRFALTYAKKDRLLFVLEHPTTPLHNNLSEIGGRGAKVKSKISGGTRSDEWREGLQQSVQIFLMYAATFGSLMKLNMQRGGHGHGHVHVVASTL